MEEYIAMEEDIAEEIIEKELQLMDKLLDELAKKESEENENDRIGKNKKRTREKY